MLPVRYIAKIYGRGRASGIARILVRGGAQVGGDVLPVRGIAAHGQLAGHRGGSGRGVCPLLLKVEDFDVSKTVGTISHQIFSVLHTCRLGNEHKTARKLYHL